MKILFQTSALALLASLAACGSDTEGDAGVSEAGEERPIGIRDSKIASGLELPDLSPDLLTAAETGGGLACELPVLPDHSNARVLDEGKREGVYETASPAGEVAAFYQAAAKARTHDIVTSGASGSTRQQVTTMVGVRCDVIAEAKASGKTEVTVRRSYTKR